MGHPLSMAPSAEAPHLVGFIRSVGFYPSLASTFPAHYRPLHSFVSLLRAITLIIIIITIIISTNTLEWVRVRVRVSTEI